MSGGTWERTASYIENEPNDSNYIKTYGKSVAYKDGTLNTISTKYSMVYPHGTEDISDINTSSGTNWNENTKIYGDAVRETSTGGIGYSVYDKIEV